MTDAFTKVKSECDPGNYQLNTAEDRAKWDRDLRAAIRRATADTDVQKHLGEMVKRWRWEILNPRNSHPLRWFGGVLQYRGEHYWEDVPRVDLPRPTTKQRN